MLAAADIVVSLLTGFFGALVVTGIGVRFTRNFKLLVCSGILSGAALAVLVYVLWGWFTHGFQPSQATVLPFAALILLVVMTAQNWFVFYEDREDALQSARPAMVLLGAALAGMFARSFAGKHSYLSLVLWAGALSLALLCCVEPVQRSIARTRSVFAGTLLGLGKILIPTTGIALFLLPVGKPHAQRPNTADREDSFAHQGVLINLAGLFWNFGELLLMILINGSRVPQHATASDAFAQSITGEMSPLKRDSVVLIFVLALHVLCGVVLARS
jgi:hypothetical protein